LKNWGVKNPSQAEKIKGKKKQTCEKHFGVDCNLKLGSCKLQIKETNRQKYGVDYPLQNQSILEKQQDTNLQRYGKRSVGQVEEFKTKAIQTNLSKFGVEHPIQNKEIHAKLEETNLKRFGVRHMAQSDKYRIERRRRFFETLLHSDRLKSRVTPMFVLADFIDCNTKNKYDFKCNTCANVFQDHLDNGRIPRCYKCYPLLYQSFAEREIADFIRNSIADKIVENDRSALGNLELDIYIPSRNLAIEFNGLYWHSELGGNKNKDYHLNKTVRCQSKGIRLIQIFEDEWLQKQDIVKKRLAHLLELDMSRIYARNCVIIPIPNVLCAEFLEKNHLQGKDNSTIKLGAYYNSELVSLMTFGKHRFSKNKDVWEMYRFCSSKNVVGIGGKLFKYFVKNYNPNQVISYADRRWSSNIAFYEKIGFQSEGMTRQGYYYMDDYRNRYYRFNFRKSVLSKKLKVYDSNLTEWENMQLNGYDRIWDCGNLRYKWTPHNF